MSTELTTQQEAAVAALLNQQEEDIEAEATFRTPILKLCQSQTKEVKAGDAEAGEFLNSLTGESYGDKIEFIISHFQKGRSVSVKGGGYRNTIEQDLIPDDDVWREAVGEEFIGTPFDEYPDAEEMYKKRVNAGEMKWGSGPKVTTTYNYTGHVIVEDEDGEALMPVRLTYSRSTKDAHDKIVSLKRSLLRGKPWWDVTFEFATQEKDFGRNTSFVVNVKKGRKTKADEVSRAIELALAASQGRVEDNAEAAGSEDQGARPAAKPEGALAV